jgi:tetratricopeptide (TPR) repeat protein
MRRLAGILLASQDGTDDLLELAARLEQTPGGAVIGATLRGVVHHNDKNPQQAVAAFERVLELDPQLREMPLSPILFWTHYGDDLLSSGRMEDANRTLSKALATNPDPALANRLGQTFFLQGEFDDAERAFRHAAELAPADHAAYLNLAKLALSRHESAEALKQLNRARSLSPRRYEVLYSLALIYRQLGRKEEADDLQEALRHLREQSDPRPRVQSADWPVYSL